ncbi:MAG TPA: leucine-rich repeat domain-containing protein [Candidatus Acidoferrum sp.]|nr:leucine-rich repeat domain-containing protein [Candidatus Acidoferrum sp.]
MKNRIVCGVVVLVATLLAASAAQAQFAYTTNNGTIIITGYTGSGEAVIIPAEITGLPVTGIGDWAFYSTGVINVTIADTVTNIGDGAFFDCESVTNIAIGANVASIGDWAFAFCSSLTNVNFRGNPPGLGGTNVFYGDAATVNYLPGSAGWGPMFGVLAAVLWNPPVPYNYITINGTITIAGYTGSDGVVTFPSAINFLPVTGIADMAFDWGHELNNVTIPSSVTNIGDSAFENCYWLTNVTFANGLLRIGSNAFLQCLILTNITIPASATNIGVGAFAACPDLTTITVDAQNAFYSSITGVLFDKSQTALLQCPGAATGSYTIPSSVTHVGDAAFEGSALTNVTIPPSVTKIGESAFEGSLLTSVTIPDSVTNIGDAAFRFCEALTNVTISSSVTSVGYSVFENCYKLGNVTIPDSVTSIGEDAFNYCYQITSVTIPRSVTNFVADAFEGCHLTNTYFQGNAPTIIPVPGPILGPPLEGTVYYLPNTTGWSNSFDGVPAVLWNPVIQTGDGSFGVRTNQFGFNITGTPNIPIVLQGADNLANPVWTSLQSLTLTNGSYYFSEPFHPAIPARFYRITSQ